MEKIPANVWTPAYDADGDVRDGAWVAELTGLLNLATWPAGMRVIVRKERPHPGAQLRLTDIDGHRYPTGRPDGPPGRLTKQPPVRISGSTSSATGTTTGYACSSLLIAGGLDQPPPQV